ncbi:MAG TPA: flavin reductase family protein [Syntrophomonadaceae bacterium]|nr:flavin reductase family protein [Syntrophomonadaceae bacterium]
MAEKKYFEYSGQLLQELPAGAFLSVKAAEQINTMTIGWGAIGYIWQRPILLVAIRHSRYTYGLIEKSGEFTVSIPAGVELKKQLKICGTKSGRDIDKFSTCSLTAQKGRKLDSPVVKECNLFFECQVVYHQAMDPDNLDESIKSKSYKDNDYHTMYYGEIVACYTNQ